MFGNLQSAPMVGMQNRQVPAMPARQMSAPKAAPPMQRPMGGPPPMLGGAPPMPRPMGTAPRNPQMMAAAVRM